VGRERKVALRGREKSIQFVFYWQGKQRFESLKIPPTPRNMKAAERMAGQIKDDLERNCLDLGEYFPESSNINQIEAGRPRDFNALSVKWMKQLELSKASTRKYQSALSVFWLPVWQDRDYRYLATAEIQEAIASIKWGSVKHRNGCITPLRSMFDFAKEAGWISINPMLKIKHIKPQKPPPTPLEPKQVIKVLEWIKENYGEHWETHFGFRLFAGARPGEIFALLPDDVDWTTDTVSIVKTQAQEGLRDLTKTSEARDIELNQYSEGYVRKALEAKGETVFCFESGKRITQGNFTREIWNSALKALGIAHRSSYNARHTCITMNIMAGANIFWLAKQMGTSVQLIEKTYAKWIRKVARDRESTKLEKYLTEIMP
jgi:integrase